MDNKNEKKHNQLLSCDDYSDKFDSESSNSVVSAIGSQRIHNEVIYLSFETSEPSITNSSTSWPSSSSAGSSITCEDDEYSSDYVDDVDADHTNTQSLFIERKLKLLEGVHKKKEKEETNDESYEREHKNFITKKVQMLKQDRLQCNAKQESKQGRPDVFVEFVPKAHLEKLKIENLMQQMKRACEEGIHQPKRCKTCKLKDAELAESVFVKTKAANLKNKITEETIDEHLYTKDTLTHVGDMLKTMPRLTDERDDIWKRLQSGNTV